MLLLHLSDTHFGTEQPPVVEALLRLVEAQPPQRVILSGDVTQRARRTEFDAARGFVARLGAARTLVVPGNHDIPLYNPFARLFAPYAGFRTAFGRELEPVVDTPDCLVLALNTTRAWRHENGELSALQVERVAHRLQRAAPWQLRIVVVHQPVAVTRREDECNLLRGSGAAVERWASAGADLVLGGHIHLPYVRALHDARPGLTRRVWAVQAGTAVSARVRRGAPNSVNLIRWGGALPAGRCVVERWDFAASEGRFVEVDATVLATGPVHETHPAVR